MIILWIRQRTKHVEIPESNHYTGSSGKVVLANESMSISTGNDFTSGNSITTPDVSLTSVVEDSLGAPSTSLDGTVQAALDDLIGTVSTSPSGSVTVTIG